MSSEERERSIVEAAVAFFTEQGFEGNTRELASRLGITQPLLYRYFATKEALIERVYDEVFLGRWDTAWEDLLLDRRRPLEERLCGFYKSYARVILTPEWIRLFMFAGLKGLDFNARYLKRLHERIFTPVVSELRATFGRPPLDVASMSEIEMEMIWALHASIFYVGVRQHIYGLTVRTEIDTIIEAKVRTMLDGIGSVLAPAMSA